jgi:segregation and condensation protein B
VPRSRLVDLFDEEEREEAMAALEAVLARYAGDEGRGVMAEEVAGGVRIATRPEMATWLRRFFDVSSGSKLSMAALETLAIVAYRQPITGPEIQELRSVSPSGVLKTLLERRLVRIAGRKEVVGKPFLYATTREFLVHFGLNSLRDLPPLEDFEEAFGGGHEAASALGELIGHPAEDLLAVDGELREERFAAEAEALAERAEGEEDGETGDGSEGAVGAGSLRDEAESGAGGEPADDDREAEDDPLEPFGLEPSDDLAAGDRGAPDLDGEGDEP